MVLRGSTGAQRARRGLAFGGTTAGNTRGTPPCLSFRALGECDFGMTGRVNVNVPLYSAGDNSAVSLAIVQAGQKDQGLYCCCLKNSYGKAASEFNLTAEGNRLRSLRCKPWPRPLPVDTCTEASLFFVF